MNMPNILMETSYGYSSCRIEDSLMQRRAVLCFGAVSYTHLTLPTNSLV